MNTVERYADRSRATEGRMSVYIEHEFPNVLMCVHVDSAQGQLNYLSLAAVEFRIVLSV